MKLPDRFPDGTIFLDVDGDPVTWHPDEGRYCSWSEFDAASPRWISITVEDSRVEVISEAEFWSLCEANWFSASPAQLLVAAKDLERWLAGGSGDDVTVRSLARELAARRQRVAALLAERAIDRARR